MIITRVSTLACLMVSAAALPQPARAQTSDQAAAQAQAGFRDLDVNADGVLSGREADVCRCAAYDTDRDGKIAKGEFYAGFMLAAFEATGQGITAPAQQPPTQPRGASTPRAFGVGDRVEVNVDGTWYPATVTTAQNGRYHLVRDDRTFGVASSDEWISGDRLRPFVDKPVPAPPPTGLLPIAVPPGVYSCTTYQTGGGGQVGKLRILNASASSGITADGSGPQHAFTYDPATGAIVWTGGLQIVGFAVERAEYRPSEGIPNINLHYRARPGGNLNSMYCQLR